MNERIFQLAKQAEIKFEAHLQHLGIDTAVITPADLEKFAELIVSEFIQQGKLIQSQTVINGSEEYITGREMGIEVFMNQVRQHFGVEE